MQVSCGPDGPPDGFVGLPAALYRDDSCWIPEDSAAVRGAFSAANPWFESGSARLVCEPGSARIAGFFEPGNVIDGTQAAYFGYWATAGAPGVDATVFSDIEAWARGLGAGRLYGPIDFTTYGNYRLLVTPDVLPFPGEPYNDVRHTEIVEDLGYRPAVRYNSRFLSENHWRPYMASGIPVLEQLRSHGYRFEPLTVEAWLGHLPELHTLADTVFADNFAYRPLPYDLFAAYCGESFVRRACPHTSAIVFGPGGDVAGVELCYPHYGPLVVQAAGNDRVAPSELDFARDLPALVARGPVDMLIKTVGVTTAHRGRNLMRALLTYSLTAGQNLDYLGCWVAATARADNLTQRSFGGQADRTHEYVLYSKDLA